MYRIVPDWADAGSSGFRKVAAAFLAGEALPFVRVLPAERIERVFAKHDGLVGRQGIYSTSMMVWSFLGQVLRDGKEASCQAAVAALLSRKQQRQIRFTATCQYVLASWMLLSCGRIPAERLLDHCLATLRPIAACEVANRPGRLEPRVLKRRQHGYPLMQKPREKLRAELRNHCT